MKEFLFASCARREVLKLRADAERAELADEPLFTLPAPARGCTPLPDGRYLACDSYTVYLIQADGSIRGDRAVGQSHLADLHWVGRAPTDTDPAARFIVCSSSADAVLLMNWAGEIHWGWWADERGWGDAEHSHDWSWRSTGCTSAQEHLAHPNSVQWVSSRESVLISVLGPFTGHVGDVPMWKKGAVIEASFDADVPDRRVVEGLRAPHHVALGSRGFTVAESQGRRVSEYDWNGRRLQTLHRPDLWWGKIARLVRFGADEYWLVGKTYADNGDASSQRPTLACYSTAGERRWQIDVPAQPFCLEPLPCAG